MLLVDSGGTDMISPDDNNNKQGKKRKRNPSVWKANVRRKLCQSGKEYVSRRGKTIPAKTIKTRKDCSSSCKFGCTKKISAEERQNIFEDFYKLSQNEKYHFYGRTTEKIDKLRCVKKGSPSHRHCTFHYFLFVGNDKHRICKDFYLGTLDVSQKPIYNFHEKKNPITGTPSPDNRGKHAKKVVTEAQKQEVRDHIDSFPRVESHYTRSQTKRQYLEPQLNVAKMYELYCKKCSNPVKLSYYRHIFVTEYNLDFHMPKADRCDLCEEFRVMQLNKITNGEIADNYKKHIAEKTCMRQERNDDRQNKSRFVVCFDLENVISLPKAGTSNFFYKRKLNLYNLTAHVSATGQAYCAVWPETLSGRSGTDIASAVVKVLHAVVHDNQDITDIITWSDSCVPQNRNSIMAFAMTDFLQSHPRIQTIEMKYSVPGHSCIQEVDAVHSCIEQAMRVAEFYSPISFIRVLLHAKRNQPFRVLQMKQDDFKEFQVPAKQFQYQLVPFTKVISMKFHQERPHRVQYRISWKEPALTSVDIHKPSAVAKKSAKIPSVNVRRSTCVCLLSKEKKQDLRSMLKWMPLEDKQYYEKTVLK